MTGIKSIAVAVLGNADVSAFAFLPIQGETPSDDNLRAAANDLMVQGWHYVGLLGVSESGPLVSIEEPLSISQVDVIADAFREHCEKVIEQREVAMINHLWSLKDARADA